MKKIKKLEDMEIEMRRSDPWNWLNQMIEEMLKQNAKINELADFSNTIVEDYNDLVEIASRDQEPGKSLEEIKQKLASDRL